MTVLEEYRATVQVYRPNARLTIGTDANGYTVYRIKDGDQVIAEDGGIIAAWREAEFALANAFAPEPTNGK